MKYKCTCGRKYKLSLKPCVKKVKKIEEGPKPKYKVGESVYYIFKFDGQVEIMETKIKSIKKHDVCLYQYEIEGVKGFTHEYYILKKVQVNLKVGKEIINLVNLTLNND